MLFQKVTRGALFLLTSVFALVLFTGCANTKKRQGEGGDEAAKGSATGAGAYEDIVDYHVDLPVRDANVNPNEVDYDTFSEYTIYFDFDSFAIKSTERAKLEQLASKLSADSSIKVMLAGHTDSRGTVQYNLGLGERRSIATREYLIGLGIDGKRISTISYGEERPAEKGENEAAWTKNRRTQIGYVR